LAELRTWRRRHTDGDISEVTSVPGMGYWIACVCIGGGASQKVSGHFALLTEAQDQADRLAVSLEDHDCSLCEVWEMVERRQTTRPRRRA